MIETVCNLVQLLVTGVCAALSLRFALKSKERAWLLLSLFYGAFFLGDLYWQMFLLFYDETPRYSYISDMSWNAGYLFLLILLITVKSNKQMPHQVLRHRPVLWAAPLFTAGMCAFFIQHGDYINNVVVAILMAGIILYASDGLLDLHAKYGDDAKFKGLYAVTLLFCLVEYLLWISSCFWMGDTIGNPYFWFDLLLSVTFALFCVALWKDVPR